MEATRPMHASTAGRGLARSTWSGASIVKDGSLATVGSVRNASGPIITLSAPGSAMQESSIQDVLRSLSEVDYRKKTWNCPFCHVGTINRRQLKKHLRKGICKTTVEARSAGHPGAFFRYCMCKGEILWPQPAWYRGENE